MARDALPASIGITDRSWLPGKGQVGFGIDFAVRTASPKTANEASGEVGEFFWDGAANTAIIARIRLKHVMVVDPSGPTRSDAETVIHTCAELGHALGN